MHQTGKQTQLVPNKFFSCISEKKLMKVVPPPCGMLVTLLTILLITLHTGNLMAMVNHSIHIEWDYDFYSVPVEAEISAYRLYKEGVQICEFDTPYEFEGDCEFTSDNGLYDFNLTAVFEDGSESPSSAPFPFLLGTEEPKPNMRVILAVLKILLR